MKLDILAIGVHPDDVELGCGGTLLKHIADGRKVGILDLTQGELGTRGSAELRLQEADAAAQVLGVHMRENLGLADGFFQNDEASQREIIKVLRKYQPEIVLANAPKDRHPDHGRASKLAYDACFLSGLRKIETELDGEKQAAWRPKNLYHYIQAYRLDPSFVVDITGHMDKKMESVLAYKSQFHNPDSDEPETFIASQGFMDMVKARAVEFGTIVGYQYAEAFVANHYPGVKDLFSLD